MAQSYKDLIQQPGGLTPQTGSLGAVDLAQAASSQPAATLPVDYSGTLAVAKELAGSTFLAKYAIYVRVGQTDFPYTDVTSFKLGSLPTRTVSDVGFGPQVLPGSGGSSMGAVEFYTVNSLDTFSDKGLYNVLAYNNSAVLLGAEPYLGPGIGYQSYLIVSTTPISSTTFPFTVDNGAERPSVPPNNNAVTGNPPGTTGPAPCYAIGTRIATRRGNVPVERLVIGDMIRLAGRNEFRPVVWIGHRSVDVARHPERALVAPVRIRAAAFGPKLPVRDLVVSPDHAIFVDGVLIPARLLVNGGSIAQEMDVAVIRYFHVELEAHAVILAEGLPAESYLGGSNRSSFDNGAVVDLYPAFASDADAYAAKACAPLVIDAKIVEPIWSRLAQRAAALGEASQLPNVTTEADFRVFVGESALTPTMMDGRLVFELPRAAASVRLVSRAARPSDTRPWLDDRRTLGVMVAGLAVQTGRGRKEIAMADSSLVDGWWAVESSDVGPIRWTDGNATVALPRGAKTLEVRLVGDMLYPVEGLPLVA